MSESQSEIERPAARMVDDAGNAVARQARKAMARGDYAAALARWDSCIDALGEYRAPDAWLLGKARALEKLRRTTEAELLAGALLRRDASLLAAAELLARIQFAGGARDRVGRARRMIGEFETGMFSGLHAGFRSLWIARLSVYLQEMSKGREALRVAIADLRSISDSLLCLRLIPVFLEPADRADCWRALARHAERFAAGALSPSGRAQLACLTLCLHLARQDFEGFLSTYDSSAKDLGSHPSGRLLDAIRGRLARGRAAVLSEEKVFGIGLSRTATTTLTDALTVLGYDAAHWTSPLTGELLSQQHFFMFNACLDSPVSNSFESLYETYPNARFIYTVRGVESWRQSVANHYKNLFGESDLAGLRRTITSADGCRYGSEFLTMMNGLYLPHPTFTSAYLAHEQRVMSFFNERDSRRLLVFDIFGGDSWPKLCDFLGKPVPNAPFPWLNKA